MTHTDDAGVLHRHDPEELHNEDVAHEHSDVNIRAIVMFGVGLVIVTAVVALLMAGMFKWLEGQATKNDPPVSPLTAPPQAMPRTTTSSPFFGHARGETQLLTNEPAALRKLSDDEYKRLHGYGWVDGKPGVAHMPIEEAKKLILERGLPARQGAPLDPAVGTHAPAMGEASGGRTIPAGKKSNAAPVATPEQPKQPQQATPHGGPGGGN